MGSLKVPEPDGFHAIFYQCEWHIVGNDLVNLVHNFYWNSHQVDKVNGAHISLIPKTNNVNKVKDFHPIGLCNVAI